MRLLALTIVFLFGCVSPEPPTYPDSDGLDLIEETNVLEFFRAFNGTDRGCRECVIKAAPHIGGERWGLFVEPQATCRVRKADVQSAKLQEVDGVYFAKLRLTRTGMMQVEQCRDRANRDDDSPRFLYVLNGEVLGSHTFFGSRLTTSGLLVLSGPADVSVIVTKFADVDIPSAEL